MSERNIAYLIERQSLQGRKPLILFFDEIDRLVDSDSAWSWQFLRLLHEAHSYNWVRLVFAGFRSAARLTSSDDGAHGSPFHGSLETITLPPLTQTETKQLLCDPFRSMDITIRDQDAIVETVQSASAGHPFLVQFFGERLFQKALDRSPQEIQPEDAGEIEQGFELNDFLESHFLWNTLQSDKPVLAERACAFVYAHEGQQQGWSEQDFLQACKRHGVNLTVDQVHEAVRNLYQARILAYEARRYKFVFPLLGEILRDSYPDISSLLDAL